MSNEQRLKLFMMIYENCADQDCSKTSVSECSGGMEKAFTKACNCLKISRSTISHHFKELQNAGLITARRTGQAFYCEVNQEAIKAIRDLIK